MSEETELYEAVRGGDVARADALPGIITPDPVEGRRGRTFLHAAAESGSLEMLRHVWDSWWYAYDDDALLDEDEQTPLHVACRHGHKAAAEYLVALGADPARADKHGMTPLGLAAEAKADELVESLLQKLKPPHPLCDAAATGQTALVQWLLQHGADPNEEAAEKADGYQPHTPLLLAVVGGHRAIAEMLLTAGAKVRWGTWWGGTPLHHAARVGDTAMCALLLDHDAPVNNWDPANSHAPLHNAIACGNGETVRLLLERGADPNDKVEDPEAHDGYDPISPLFMAMRQGNRDIAEILLDHGADPNDRRVGATTLYQVPGSLKSTPLHMAVERTDLRMTDLLLQRGADPNLRDRTGATALHVAASDSHPSEPMVALLLSHGADPTLRNNEGATPIDLAQRAGHEAIATALRSAVSR